MQLPNIPKFSTGSPVEVKILWKRATVYRSKWDETINEYSYLLIGDDINPRAFYKQSDLVEGIPNRPTYQAEFN